MDPLAGSTWSEAGTVAGFSQSPPNARLIEYAAHIRGSTAIRVLDIGCGAGRNAVPLAEAGARVVGVDLSLPMLQAATRRKADRRLDLMLAPMDALPVRSRAFDLVIAHGIWNLARSAREFRRAIAEAARAARQGARLFVFTFSRHTLSPQATPVAGEPFVFTQFSGTAQIFLTRDQFISELAAHGFAADHELPIRELNLPPALSEQRSAKGAVLRVEGPPGQVRMGGAPVIYEGGFRMTGISR